MGREVPEETYPEIGAYSSTVPLLSQSIPYRTVSPSGSVETTVKAIRVLGAPVGDSGLMVGAAGALLGTAEVNVCKIDFAVRVVGPGAEVGVGVRVLV